jgi:hypothetical protein
MKRSDRFILLRKRRSVNKLKKGRAMRAYSRRLARNRRRYVYANFRDVVCSKELIPSKIVKVGKVHFVEG